MKSLQHLVVKIEPDMRYDYWIRYHIPDFKKEGAFHLHNENGPAAIDITSKIKQDLYYLFGIYLSREEWEKQVQEIKFSKKFEDLIS